MSIGTTSIGYSKTEPTEMLTAQETLIADDFDDGLMTGVRVYKT